MGHVEAHRTATPAPPSELEAPRNNVNSANETEPASGEQVRMAAPTWMDAVAPSVAHRRGVIPAARSGMGTLSFFALIVASVAAAGIFAVSVWGPDKTPKSRTQFATNPEPPIALPSLPEEPSPSALDGREEPAAASSPEPAPAAPSGPKTPKKGPRPSAKKAR